MAPQDDLTAAERAAVQKFYYSLNAGVEGGEHQDADEHQDIDRIMALLQQTRQQALRKAAKEVRTQKADDKVAEDLNQTLSFDTYNMTLESIASKLDQLASEGG